ncbi:MAG: SDR family NAD(P)-dependent oxidoreductase [Sphaerochaetaceae bacterium]
MKFKNKVVVITGAGGGLGRQLVLQMLAKGASVAAVDISRAALEQTELAAGRDGDRISIHVVDITDNDRVRELPEEVLRLHGAVDVLINNAGIIQPFITLAELDDAAIHRLMNINFFGMLNMTRAFIPFLAESEAAMIGNVSSMGGFLPVPGQSIYGASKAAVKIATEGLRMELSKTNIKVSLILPGGIATDIKKNSGLNVEPPSEQEKQNAGLSLLQPEEAARIIIKGLEKEKVKIFPGKDSAMMDKLYRLSPVKAGNMIRKVMAKNHGGVINTTEKLLHMRLKKAM